MKTFKEWFEEYYPTETLPNEMSGGWFADHGIPMIVHCTCCEMTMCVVSALIDEDNHTYCSQCGEVEDC